MLSAVSPACITMGTVTVPGDRGTTGKLQEKQR